MHIDSCFQYQLLQNYDVPCFQGSAHESFDDGHGETVNQSCLKEGINVGGCHPDKSNLLVEHMGVSLNDGTPKTSILMSFPL